MEIAIPHNFKARSYQIPFLREVERAMEGRSEKRFFYQIWHRRSGKDKSNIADCVPRRLLQDPTLVKYVYPTLVMARDNMWDAMGKDGFKFTSHIPDAIRIGVPNETRMTIKTRTVDGGESLFQMAGTNRPDTLRGGNSKLYIFSEWADHDPYAFDVIEPILRENDGIAIFNTTPKGDNHARALYEFAKTNPKWFVSMLTVDDTHVFSPEEMEAIKVDTVKRFESSGRSAEEALAYINQEYYCSFDSPVLGSYYGAGISKAEKEGRIATVPYEQGLPVHTAWDLGMDDSTTIWFFQVSGGQFRLIDYYETSGEGLAHYAGVLQERKYVYGSHFAPHDIEVRELGSGKSRLEMAKGFGIAFKVAPRLDLEDGINATRGLFGQMWFDRDKCNRGIQALKNYKKDWDEKNLVFRNNPLHNWASHGADALRTMATAFKRPVTMPDPSSVGGVLPYYEGLPG